MKKILFAISIVTFATLFTSCKSDDSYAQLLDDEADAINNYISRNNIQVISEAPADGVWGENQYLQTNTGLYIHIVDAGEDDGSSLHTGQQIIARYNKITLDAQPDTVYRNWNPADYPYPTEFQYTVYDSSIPTAFQEAVSIMKKHNSVAKLIVPSKIGNSSDINAVVPYVYDLKIKLAD